MPNVVGMDTQSYSDTVGWTLRGAQISQGWVPTGAQMPKDSTLRHLDPIGMRTQAP